MMVVSVSLVFLFFFKQNSAYNMRIRDWISDVCSSDLCAKTRHGSSPCYHTRVQNGPDRVRGRGGKAARANVAEQRCGGAMTAARKGNDRVRRLVPEKIALLNFFSRIF